MGSISQSIDLHNKFTVIIIGVKTVAFSIFPHGNGNKIRYKTGDLAFHDNTVSTNHILVISLCFVSLDYNCEQSTR